ncbi:hypothetical protein [Caulobacter segnis]|uniref:Uncharacterized protein n=1 Tax=Caulobacter segnis (strain ATCC 21756 / DSM 7131 / JCM 7823 / NBRC 15250 / LMG 17158 / TK0059) TaxID=509190 RepID=D5VFP2_CAUST|nr:hypothetical protein [Caulobacter segnis]ADG09774.1 hypothetical protein Cseg_1275 [Caulobacter segnis ATCC 21756]
MTAGTAIGRPDATAYLGSIGDVVDEVMGSVGVAGVGRVEPFGCVPPSVGGVEGMLDPDIGGFTDAPMELDEEPMVPIDDESVEEPLMAPLFMAGAVAEVSVDMPVCAVDDPAHQSFVARALGEAFV